MASHRVYVSHAYADNALCKPYVETLRDRFHLDLWYDASNTQYGIISDDGIGAEIKGRTAFVVFLTPASVASEWVRQEIAIALACWVDEAASRVLLPVILEPVEVPPHLRSLAYIDGTRLSFDQTVSEIAHALTASAHGVTPAPPARAVQGMVRPSADVSRPVAAPMARRSSRTLLAVLSAIMLALLGAAGVYAYPHILGAFQTNRARAANTATAVPTTAFPSPTVTLTPTASPAPYVVFTDPLTSPDSYWQTDCTGSTCPYTGSCYFATDGYHGDYGQVCLFTKSTYLNADVSIRAQQVGGSIAVGFGLVLRYQPQSHAYYAFLINRDGAWRFIRVTASVTELIPWTATPAIKQGFYAENTLEVRMTGSHFQFLINGTTVGQADDGVIASPGNLGIHGADAESAFTDFKVGS